MAVSRVPSPPPPEVNTPVAENWCYTQVRVLRSVLVTSNVAPSSPIFVTLMMEALHSSETSVLTRAIWRDIPEHGILHGHRRENLESYIVLIGWTL
jgi:hypothetical protein